ERGYLSTVIDKNELGRAIRVSEYTTHDNQGRPMTMNESVPNQPDEVIYDWSFQYSANKLVQYAHPRGELTGGFTETYIYNDSGDIFSFEVTAENYFHKEVRSEEHTSELQSRENLVCRLLLEKKKIIDMDI